MPDYEKFYMVGIDALRGFELEDLCPRDNSGSCVGGDKFVQFNAEVRFPLVPQAGAHRASPLEREPSFATANSSRNSMTMVNTRA